MKTTDDDNVITGVFGKSGGGKQSLPEQGAGPKWVDFKKTGNQTQSQLPTCVPF